MLRVCVPAHAAFVVPSGSGVQPDHFVLGPVLLRGRFGTSSRVEFLSLRVNGSRSPIRLGEHHVPMTRIHDNAGKMKSAIRRSRAGRTLIPRRSYASTTSIPSGGSRALAPVLPRHPHYDRFTEASVLYAQNGLERHLLEGRARMRHA